MIGEPERVQPEPRGLGHQLLGLAGTVEEAERRVGVQLCVRDMRDMRDMLETGPAHQSTTPSTHHAPSR